MGEIGDSDGKEAQDSQRRLVQSLHNALREPEEDEPEVDMEGIR